MTKKMLIGVTGTSWLTNPDTALAVAIVWRWNLDDHRLQHGDPGTWGAVAAAAATWSGQDNYSELIADVDRLRARPGASCSSWSCSGTSSRGSR